MTITFITIFAAFGIYYLTQNTQAEQASDNFCHNPVFIVGGTLTLTMVSVFCSIYYKIRVATNELN